MRSRTLSPAALVLALLGALMVPNAAVRAQEEGFFGSFRDPDDGSFDMSAWLAQAHGFLPVVSLITEPAVDYGVAGAAAFFHRPEG